MKTSIPVLGLCLLCGVATAGAVERFSPGDPGHPGGAAAADSEPWTSSDCLLKPSMVVDLSSPVVGVVERVLVDRGDTVRNGGVVIRLRSEVERALVALNRAQLAFDETTQARNRELYEQNLISAQELDELEIKSKLSRLELNATRARLSQKSIASPVDGVVIARLVDPGEYVGESPLLTIARLDPLYAEVVLPKDLFGSVKPEMPVVLGIESPLDDERTARVLVVDPVVDAASGTFKLRLELPNPGNRIPAGLKCTIRLRP